MPTDEGQRPEYNTHERLSALIDECETRLSNTYEEVEAACEEKDFLGDLAENLVFDTLQTALRADRDDTGTQAAGKILAGNIELLTKASALPIGNKVAQLRVAKQARAETIAEQLERLSATANKYQEPSRELLAELGTLSQALKKYDRTITQYFSDIEWSEGEFVKRADIAYEQEIGPELERNPKSDLLKTLMEMYNTKMTKFKDMRQKMKPFTEGSHGVAEYNNVRGLLKSLAVEETELETYLTSRGM